MTDDLRRIPGVGPRTAEALRSLGIEVVTDLVGQDPERLYQRMQRQDGGYVDRCVLYVFRCAIYFAETADPDPDLLKWWAWKDR